MQTYLILIFVFFSFGVGIAIVFCLDFFLYFLKNKKANILIAKAEINANLIVNQLKADLKIKQQQSDFKLKEYYNLQNKKMQERLHFLKLQEELAETDKTKIEKIKKSLEQSEKEQQNINNQLIEQRKLILIQLEKASGMSQEEAMSVIVKNLEKVQSNRLNKLTKERINEAEKNIKTKVNDILASALERYASDYVINATVYKIELKDEETKGKIIGKQGRNIKAFQELSGVDIIIDPNSSVIRLSSFNPLRRTIALSALKKLIQDGRIQPQRIKEFLEQEEKNIDFLVQKIGQETVDDLKILNLDPKLIKHIGLLKFRTSYGQSVLQHSIEVAKLAGALASELKLDDEIAIRAGLLHDIGKSKDYELGLSHVVVGVELARECQEDEIIINAIHAHHDDVPKDNVYSVLVSIADTLSAARPGARDNVKEDYFQRMKKIEEICKEIEGVRESHAVKAGRVVRIILDASKVNDFDAEKIAEKVKLRLKTELKIPGDVLIEVIREVKISKNI